MKRGVGKLALVSLMSLAVLAACGQSKGKEESTKSESVPQVINITSEAQISTMDPALAADTTSTLAMNQVYEGLYTVGKDDEFVLGVAKEEPVISDDLTTYTFKLRDDAKWSDGSQVTAEDFVYGWQQIVTPSIGSPNADVMVGVIKNAKEIYEDGADPKTLGVKAIDETTLEVQLERPVPYLKSLLTFAIFYPKKETFITEQGKDFATSSEKLLYNGPFVMEGWEAFADEWTYKPNAEYWDKDTVKLDSASVQVIKTPSTAVNLFESGEVDVVNKLTSEYAKNYKDNASFLPVEQYVTFFLKLNAERNGKKTPLDNKDLRQAIAQSFDKEAFVTNILGDGSTPTDHLIPKGQTKDPASGDDFTEVAEKTNTYLTYNPEGAKKSLELAKKDLGDKIELEFLTDDTEVAKTSAEFFSNQIETNLPGVKINIVQVPFTVRVERDQKKDYDIELSGWGTDYRDPMTVMRIFVTNNSSGGITYSNPVYDQLINDSREKDAGDVDKRFDNFIKAENELINKDTVIAPIYNRSLAILANQKIKDMYWHPFGSTYSLKWAHVE
ncbi:oligopeptide transport system substrate-binding protein [Vagococcus fluvialis]|uniref:Peptide ABC transporter substrate-binding protein n=1 Tax=Vagococcus fluvialis TaxID=2738 RepID=A0A369B3E8_9ENTE|nr:peptide ABC transporter substrate-binding protein [Vagococcus fluvialis]MBO0479828.1 peptide ABC transporter substrate-binding protein [Vagococcus fluvialis]MBO0483382.1 peptide ABC transporter substrate-binding protein [Vagococcus fluvialis]NKC67008.1 peptide ABC transporter substrate-binding protein [Vagococcus fluvialis]RCX15108.1 oligopeptide transport system substrate-binding protein [Vagococcus fluvialis]RSU05610.1 peptide ABC transporter substrate-binding protein [Vagococcus fluviali